ncbi:MAG TPA: glycosyltransferase family 2 protein [Firmicutes bacterium]|nr:glycosyltransferase family 2 protein [Bacillota bacterium]
MYGHEIVAVVPCHNEAKSIGIVIANCLKAGCDRVLVVANGCVDDSAAVARRASSYVDVVEITQPLGMDVPRAIGGKEAISHGAYAVLFVDGDMSGDIAWHLRSLVDCVEAGTDIALSDCFRQGIPGFGMAGKVAAARLGLNRLLGLIDSIGAASPSHGPSCYSCAALKRLERESPGLRCLAVPPVSVALAKKLGLRIAVGSTISHDALGSPYKSGQHCNRLADTIIGDCIEAECVYLGLPVTRIRDGHLYDGYNSERRFDLIPI